MAKTKDVKRADAEARKKAYDAMPGYDKLTVAASRRGQSAREKTRILARAGS